MTRRILGIIAASVLALAGTVALVAFVAGAEERALEGEQLVEVYVVSQPIPSGTPASEVEESVVVEEVPAKVRPIDAVDSLPELANRVTAVDLQPGEQLIDSRFVEVSVFTDREVGVEVPDEMIEITIEMDPERAIGGLLEPGQTVAVFASFEPFDITSTLVDLNGEIVALPESVADDAEGSTPNTTNIILRKALVSAVQEDTGGSFGSEEDGENDRLSTAPDSDLLVTLALSPSDAERLVFTAEFGFIWLAIERDTVPEADDSIKTRGNVYIDEDGDIEDGDFVILGPSTSGDDDTESGGEGEANTDSGATDTESGTADEQAAGR